MISPDGSNAPALTTPRYTMRGLRRGDAAALMPTLGDPAQCRYLSQPAFQTEQELWDWLAEPGWPGRTWIAEDGKGAVVGRYVAVPQGDGDVQEIGYITCADFQGRGAARECVGALIAHLFAGEGKSRLVAEVDIENAASLALLNRLGFIRTGFLPAHEETHKGLCDIAIYSLRNPTFPEQ